MWLFLEGGRFLSLSADPDNADLFRVRARLPGDIDTDFPNAEIQEFDGGPADYRYEARIPRTTVLAAIADELDTLSYESLTKTICNRNRVNAMIGCRNALTTAQNVARAGQDEVSVCHR